MDDLQSRVKFALLTRRVRWIAVGCICFNILWLLFIVEDIVTSLNQNIQKHSIFVWWKVDVVENFAPRIIGNVIGISISIPCCTLLYIGAKIRNAYFLIPFIVVAYFALLGLSSILLFLFFYFIELLLNYYELRNDDRFNECALNTLMCSILIIILIPTTYWMLRNTKELWVEICKNAEISRNGATELELSGQITTNDAENCSQVYQHRNVLEIEVSVIQDDSSNVFFPE